MQDLVGKCQCSHTDNVNLASLQGTIHGGTYKIELGVVDCLFHRTFAFKPFFILM